MGKIYTDLQKEKIGIMNRRGSGILLESFTELIDSLNAAQVPYAVCGGLALAVYGRPRATIDIDLLVLPENVDAIVHLAGSLGFVGEDELRGLGGGQLVITRMIRVVPPVEDFVILDLIHATGPLLAVYEQRQNFTLPGGYLWVLSRAALIEMKLRRNSKQDMADIEVLQEDKDES